MLGGLQSTRILHDTRQKQRVSIVTGAAHERKGECALSNIWRTARLVTTPAARPAGVLSDSIILSLTSESRSPATPGGRGRRKWCRALGVRHSRPAEARLPSRLFAAGPCRQHAAGAVDILPPAVAALHRHRQ